MKKPYKDFTVEELVQDTFFYEWVTAPTEKHNSYWQLWMAVHHEETPKVEEAKRIIRRLVSEQDSPAKDYIEMDWRQIQAAIGPETESALSRGNIRKYAVAASLLLLLMAFGQYLWWQKQNNSWKQIETAYGERQTVLLPDGSEVILNGNSMLRYKGNWKEAADKREVWLYGEAFFQVTKHQVQAISGEYVQAEFQVNANHMQVEVLGTKFNVRTRKKQTQVVLSEGSVLVEDEFKNSLLLQPGEMAEYNEQLHQLQKRPVNDQAYTSWKEGKIIFDNEVIEDIFQWLQETYGWKVKTPDKSLLKKHYTGSVPVDHVDLLFDKLATLYNLEVRRQDKIIRFEKK